MKWAKRIALVMAGAALVHVLAVWLLPRAIVRVVQRSIAADVGMNHIHHAPLPDASWRTVVMPSPDLLYSACAFDVNERPLVIRATVPDGYFSISAFANDTDNFFVLNDRTASAKQVRVVLARDPSFRDPEGGIVVAPPTLTGIVLFRQLVLDRAKLPAAVDVQQAASCMPL